MASLFRKFNLKKIFRTLILILIILIAWGMQKIFNGTKTQTKIAKADTSCWTYVGTTGTTSTTGDGGCATGGTTDGGTTGMTTDTTCH